MQFVISCSLSLSPHLGVVLVSWPCGTFPHCCCPTLLPLPLLLPCFDCFACTCTYQRSNLLFRSSLWLFCPHYVLAGAHLSATPIHAAFYCARHLIFCLMAQGICRGRVCRAQVLLAAAQSPLLAEKKLASVLIPRLCNSILTAPSSSRHVSPSAHKFAARTNVLHADENQPWHQFATNSSTHLMASILQPIHQPIHWPVKQSISIIPSICCMHSVWSCLC